MSRSAQRAPQFVTEFGVDVPALTTEQMRELDRIAMEETGPNLFQMMENAGRNLAQVAIGMLGRAWQAARITVLAGPGGNGGGGICAARHLANHRGRVALVLSDPDHLRDVPAMQRKIFRQTQGQEIERSRVAEQRPDLIVDALIGYGLNAAPRGAAADLIRWANGVGAPILALDVPSGIDSTTGEAPGVAIESQRTMTLALPKTGLFRATTGDLFLADIGIPQGAYRRVAATYISPFEDRFWVSLTRR